MMPHGGEAEEGVGAGVDSIATYSWVAEKEYREDACDILAYTRYYPLDTCFCGWEECKVWSKSGANTITQKDFALTDTSCQNPKKAEVVITGITGTCLNSWGTYYKYEFAGDGPGTVAEVFATTTCDPGTSTGQHRYWKSSTCEGGGNGYQGEEPESWKDVCEQLLLDEETGVAETAARAARALERLEQKEVNVRPKRPRNAVPQRLATMNSPLSSCDSVWQSMAVRTDSALEVRSDLYDKGNISRLKEFYLRRLCQNDGVAPAVQQLTSTARVLAPGVYLFSKRAEHILIQKDAANRLAIL
eukprot:Skav226304  [mRNA]  locus=scaffold3301:391463:403847:+ [translate_table: standard]